MAVLSLRRAFRLRIEPDEVLDDERAAMIAARPPITDATQQAFMAWRRSVLFMAALLMIAVVIFDLVSTIEIVNDTADAPGALKGFFEGLEAISIVLFVVEVGFVLTLWTQVRRWTSWRRQARTLAVVWIVWFLTPFLAFLYPIASAIDYGELGGEGLRAAQMSVGAIVGAAALASLLPRVISLLQGLLRAALATKTLFPGASAPGWLLVIVAPLYLVIFYVVVLLPYQLTQSGLVLAGMVLVLVAKASLVRAGLRLARPMSAEVARRATSRTLGIWMSFLICGIGCIAAGLWDLLAHVPALTVIHTAISAAANILLLTLITTDALITSIDRAHGVTADERRFADETRGQVAAFTSAGSL